MTSITQPAGARQLKPSIIQVIHQYVPLRPAGRSHVGLCPFHIDKHPSLSVSEEKGLFHCFACGAAGDVFNFIMKIEKVNFPEACAILGMGNTHPRRPARSEALLIKAHELAMWADEMTAKAAGLLRNVGQRIQIAADAGCSTEDLERLAGEWTILESLAEDLQDEKCLLKLLQQREAIENILSAGVIEPSPEFPPLTPEYRDRLATLPFPPVETRGKK